MYTVYVSQMSLSYIYIYFLNMSTLALIFDGSVNPAHPKHIGSIDPTCDVVEVIKGK